MLKPAIAYKDEILNLLTKDESGDYRDVYIYEIVKENT